MASGLQMKDQRHKSGATVKGRKRELLMFAHSLDCQARSGRSEQVGSILATYILRILQGQEGFVDFLVLSDATDHERFCVSASGPPERRPEEYHHQHYEEIFSLLESALESSPALQGFTVGASTAHYIGVSRVGVSRAA
jgi:hypothetical protein